MMSNTNVERVNVHNAAIRTYYRLKPIIPRSTQIWIRRMLVRSKLAQVAAQWPIHERAGIRPDNWMGWPQNKRFGVILTHDVESAKGQMKSCELAKAEMALGFRSLFNFVPERYEVLPEIRNWLTDNGYEVGVHGLNHDGNLYGSYEIFHERAIKINQYLADWGSVGFRSPAMHHNLAWIGELNILYDLSTFDTDPFEPQSDGANTIFPFWVERSNGRPPYLEMPYTLPQDHTLFVIMKEANNATWKKKIDWIAEKGGMVLINVHPDYIQFNQRGNLEEYPIFYYTDLLNYIRDEYAGEFWHGLPSELFAHCQANMLQNKTNHRKSDFVDESAPINQPEPPVNVEVIADTISENGHTQDMMLT